MNINVHYAQCTLHFLFLFYLSSISQQFECEKYYLLCHFKSILRIHWRIMLNHRRKCISYKSKIENVIVKFIIFCLLSIRLNAIENENQTIAFDIDSDSLIAFWTISSSIR